MKKILIIILFLLSAKAFAQDTTYYDADWNKAPRYKAAYFTVYTKDGNFWKRTDYYLKSKRAQMKGTYSSINPEVKEGYFEYYYESGRLKHTGNFTNGKETGVHIWYRETGNLEAKENYANGKLDGPYEEYYENGKLYGQSNYVKGIREGWTTYFREDGSKLSEGNFKNGKRAGEWKFYDETGKVEETNIFKTDFNIPEASMFIRMPNDEWCLSKHSEDKIISYTFLRSPIKDSSGRAISPAILIYIDDAKIFDKNVTKFSITKRGNFVNVGLKLDKISSPSDKGYPIAYKNSLFMKTSYTDKNNMEHILYTAYIINNDDKGIQIYMDMTKDISKTCETEFMQAFKSIKEIKK